MAAFLLGWGGTAIALLVITVVFAIALRHLTAELGWIKALTDHLGYELAVAEQDAKAAVRPGASLASEGIREELEGVRGAADPAWANKQVRGWQMRAQRLEAALAFWCDLLRHLGLLGTVLGLGLSLVVEPGNVEALLGPLSLAVWTTVAGLTYSLILTVRFGTTLTVWADTCEKNIEAWDSRRKAAVRSGS